MPVWMVASRWSARAGLYARIRDRAILTALVMFTRGPLGRGSGRPVPAAEPHGPGQELHLLARFRGPDRVRPRCRLGQVLLQLA